ncbi:hypothetical protein WJX72_007286 [[Myrmecia] bisecta]|uniref:Uncharacterized protein n=1 Tax=[Myrmecia] bisecta TaxID=41462 RepID=A0AAW1Q1E2_9CHLO
MDLAVCSVPQTIPTSTLLPFWPNAQLPTIHDTANALPTPWVPADADFCEILQHGRRSKRMRLSFDGGEIEDLSHECDRLRAANALLESQLNNVLNNVHAAIDENRTLVKLIAALQPHKQGFSLQPSSSLSSLSAAGPCPSGGGSSRRSTAVRMDSLGSSDASTPGTPGKSSGEGRGMFRRSRSGHTDDSSQATQDMAPGDVCVDQGAGDPERAETEAIAAAALAVNHGNPAAALIDLLMLSRKRSNTQMAAGI